MERTCFNCNHFLMCYVKENAFKLIKKMPLNCDIPEYDAYHTIFWETIANLCEEFKLEEIKINQ